MRYLVLVLVIMITSCTFRKSPPNKLLSINNLENFFNQDYSYNLDYLISSELSDQKKVKSISIYRYSSAYQKYLLEDSIILNKSGKPVMNFKPDESNRFSLSYYFYDDNGNRYLDITIGSNRYDTTYTLTTFDEINRVHKEIRYNATRKEYGRIYVTTIIPTSDSLLNIKYEFYDSDLKHENILPFETRDIEIGMLNDSIVRANTTRIVQHDTTYNSIFKDIFKIKNNTLVPANSKSIINPNVNSSCLETRYNQCAIKRTFEYYRTNENDVDNDFLVNQLIIKTLRIKVELYLF